MQWQAVPPADELARLAVVVAGEDRKDAVDGRELLQMLDRVCVGQAASRHRQRTDSLLSEQIY